MNEKGIIDRVISYSENDPGKAFSIYLDIVKPARTLTFRDLHNGASCYAGLFSSLGVKPGEVVCIILENSPDLAQSFLGAMMLGALPTVLAPPSIKISPARYASMLASMLGRSNARVIITYAQFKAKYEDLLAQHVPNFSIHLTEASRLHKPTAFRTDVREVDPAFLQHSSGTTGLQKGVVITHGAITAELELLKECLKLTETDSVISWLPLYHDMGLIACFLLPMYWGISCVQIPTFDWLQRPGILLDGISNYKATLCWLPNFAYSFLANRARSKDCDWSLSSVRLFINCSEPVTRKAHEDFLERFRPYGVSSESLSSSYGTAENVFAITQSTPGVRSKEIWVDRGKLQSGEVLIASENGVPLVSSGAPVPGTNVGIIGANKNVLLDRRVGEIVISGNCLFTGYFHNAEATHEALQNKSYATGDLGFFHNGELYVTGRKKDLIIVGGKNIYPQDIEALAYECPDVHPGRAAAFSVYDEQLGTDSIVLIVEQSPPSTKSAAEIQIELKKLISAGMDCVVDAIFVMPLNWLIKSTSGKISRSMNRTQAVAQGFL